jgi:PrcB C-terminal
MIGRCLPLLLLALAGCSSGRVTPAGGPAPAAPAGGSGPVSTAPGPTSAPAPTPPAAPGAPSPASAGAPAGESPPIRPIGQWRYARIDDVRRLVIQDPVTWTRFWNQLGADGAQPVIDFRRELLVAVTQGVQPNGGVEVAVERVVLSDGALTIGVVERSPGPDCMTTEVITHPAQVVALPAAGVKRWSFVERKEIRSCR